MWIMWTLALNNTSCYATPWVEHVGWGRNCLVTSVFLTWNPTMSMSPSCSLTSAHFLIFPVCFAGSRQSRNGKIPGRLLRVTFWELCWGDGGKEGSETSLWGSQAQEETPSPVPQACLPLGSTAIHVFKQRFVGYPAKSRLTYICWYYVIVCA